MLCTVHAEHIFKDRGVCLHLMLFISLSYTVPLVAAEFCMTCAVSPVGRDGKANRDGKLSQCFLMLMDSAKVSAINLFLCCISFRRSRHRTRVIWMQMSQKTDTCTQKVHLQRKNYVSKVKTGNLQVTIAIVTRMWRFENSSLRSISSLHSFRRDMLKY